MSDNKLKIDVVLADVGESGAVLSDFVTQDLHNTDMAKKADLVNGKVVPTQLPEFSELIGVTNTILELTEAYNRHLETSVAEMQDYVNQRITGNMSDKADLQNGFVALSQIPTMGRLPGASAFKTGIVDAVNLLYAPQIRTLQEAKADLLNGKLVRVQLPDDVIFKDNLNLAKAEINNSINLRAFDADVYKKWESLNKTEVKQITDEIQTAVNKKAEKTDVYSKNETYDRSTIDSKYPSITGFLEQAQLQLGQVASGLGGMKGFETEAQMRADVSSELNTLARVTATGIDYLWVGGATGWKQVGENAVQAVKTWANLNRLFNPTALVAGDDVDKLPIGLSVVPSDSIAATLLGTLPIDLQPPRRGMIFSLQMGTTSIQMWFKDSSTVGESYYRTGNGQLPNSANFAWLPWSRRLDNQTLEDRLTSFVSSVLEVNPMFKTDVVLDNGVDFDAVRQTGYRRVLYQNSHANNPGGTSISGGILYTYWAQGVAYQRFTDYRDIERQWERSGNGGTVSFAWKPWSKVPTSLDLNNLRTIVQTDIESSKKLILESMNQRDELVNLIPSSFFEKSSLPTTTVNSLLSYANDKEGRVVCRVEGNPAAQYSHYATANWTFNRSEFYGNVFSAGVNMENWTNVTEGYVVVYQRDANGTTLRTTYVGNNLIGDNSVKQQFYVSDIPILADTATISLFFRFVTTAGVIPKFEFSRPFIVAANTSVFVPSKMKQNTIRINGFPSPSFNSTGSSKFEAKNIVENGENVVLMDVGVKQIWYDIPVSKKYPIGSTVNLTVNAFSDVASNTSSSATSGDIAIGFFDASSVQIGTYAVDAVTAAGEYVSLNKKSVVPIGASFIRLRFCARANANVVKFKNPIFTCDSEDFMTINNTSQSSSTTNEGAEIFFVSASGSDANDGSESSPFASLQKVTSSAKSKDVVIVVDGNGGVIEHNTRLSTTTFNSVEIRAKANSKPIFLCSPSLGAVTKTVGFENVYQAAVGTAPTRWAYIHNHMDPTRLIAREERLAHQKGRQSRLPSTRLEGVATLALVNTTNLSWFWESGVLYFNPTLLGLNDYTVLDIRVPNRNQPLIDSGNGRCTLKITGVRVMYSSGNGLNTINYSSIELRDVESLCNAGQGFALNDSKYIQLNHCEAGSNGGDGFNMHRNLVNPNFASIVYFNENCWSHDNYDDGDSMHENCEGFYQNSLFEYNGDRGIATSYGSHAHTSNCIARYNGQIFNSPGSSNGEGFAVVGEVNTANDNGEGTQMTCMNCLSYGNIQNYAISSGGGSILLIGCKSRNAVNAAFHRTVIGSYMELQDCTDFGSPIKVSGTVVINNGELIS